MEGGGQTLFLLSLCSVDSGQLAFRIWITRCAAARLSLCRGLDWVPRLGRTPHRDPWVRGRQSPSVLKSRITDNAAGTSRISNRTSSRVKRERKRKKNVFLSQKIGRAAGESAQGGGVSRKRRKKEVVAQHRSRSHRRRRSEEKRRGTRKRKYLFLKKRTEAHERNGRTVLSILMTALCRCLPDHSHPAGTAPGLNRAGDFPSPSTTAATAALQPQPITAVGEGGGRK